MLIRMNSKTVLYLSRKEVESIGLAMTEIIADLGEIVAGKKAGRQTAQERTICVNLGIALDDMAAAILIYRQARERGIGTELPL
jgi:ornithine cyclodeaminase/alanine dehydrogenase-like protein (mu-crystallin family)